MNRPTGLADALRERSHALHGRAERSGIVQEILRGRADRHGYALFVRNLLPAYQAMEQALDRLRGAPGIGRLAQTALYRSEPLVSDLKALAGLDWHSNLRLLPEGDQYGRRVAAAAEGDGARLIAHAYARYLGDLNGGQVIKRLLMRSLHLSEGSLAFFEFPDIADLAGFGVEYRAAIDLAGSEIRDIDPVIDEVAVAFELNIQLSEAVQAAVAR